MTKILTVDEMLFAARESNMPGANDFVRAVETLATGLAHSLANHLGIGTNYADFQPGFGGTGAPFFSTKSGQECPDVIDQGDVGGDWENGDNLQAQADDAPQTLGEALARCVASLAADGAAARSKLAGIEATQTLNHS